jgi:cobalt-zinc-cadmium efflux system protein
MMHSNTHSHNHVDTHTPTGSTNSIKVAFLLNLGITLLEIVGGLWTNSLAILSDAVHDLGDSLSLGLSWYLAKVSDRGNDHKFSYGYRRYSLLGALINTLILIFGGVFVLSQAIPRLLHPEPIHAPGMVLFAVVGILINGAAVLRLRGQKDLNARVAALHLLEDVLGWAAVLVVSIILLFKDIPILDPALSIMITVYVLYNVIANLKKTLSLFLQGVPEGIEIQSVEDHLLALEQVQSLHHTHIWSLDGAHHVLTTHVVVDDGSSREDILQLKKTIKEYAREIHIEHVTVEVEYEEEDCHMKHPNGSGGCM